MENRHIAKTAFGMSGITFVSRLFGLVREWLRGYLLGTSHSSDAFTLAFLFPNLMRRLVGEGALMVAFIPVVSDYVHRDREELEDFVYGFFTVLFCSLIAIVGVTVAAAPVLKFFLPEFARVPGKVDLTVSLTRLMFPYLFFISLAALSQGILNAYKVFIPSATTPILLNISIITAGFLLGGYMREPAYALGIGVLAGGVLQFFFQVPFLSKRGIRYRFRLKVSSGVKRVFMLMVPGALGAGVYQVNALVSQFIAAFLEEGTVAALRFSLTLIELVLGIFIISITTVILPVLSEKASKGDREGMKKNLSFALRLCVLITLPSTIGLMVLRHEVITMLFRYGRFTENSVRMVATALVYHAFGLAGIGGTRVLVQMFFSMKDMKTPVYIAAGAMIVNLVLCYYLARPLRLGGIALAGSISSYCQFIFLIIILQRRVGRIVDRRTLLSSMKSLLSCALMGVVLYYLRGALGIVDGTRATQALLTVGMIGAGVIVFILVNLSLKNRDIIELIRVIAGKIRPE